jgi:hypothetical protein
MFVVTCACIVLGLVNLYGRWGAVIATPHILVLTIAWALWHRVNWQASALMIGVYAALWVMTAVYGPEMLQNDVANREDLYGQRRLSHAVGVQRAIAPCPFVISCEYYWKLDGYPLERGVAGRAFALVLPGFCWHFAYVKR